MLVILIVVVGAPLVEELLYRGLILRVARGRINDALAVVGLGGVVRARPPASRSSSPDCSLFGVVLAVLRSSAPGGWAWGS